MPILNEIELSAEQIRQLQLTQLEILIEVDRICRENNIKYSLDGGTLLGAVRHKGFIPWDDDIDLIMMRNDYEKFYNACVKNNKIDITRFFLQEQRTDKYYHVGYSRIRRNGSVYERAGHEHMRYHKGIFIDIFILDSVPDNIMLQKLHCFLCFCLRKMLWAESGKLLHKKKLLRIWYGIISRIPRDFTFFLLNKFANVCNKNSNTLIVRHMTHPYPKKNMIGLPRNLMFEFIELPFEGYSFMAIKNYDEYLKMLYGDYMKLPSPEKRKVHIHLSAFSPANNNILNMQKRK